MSASNAVDELDAATEEQAVQLEQSMADLEAMVRDVEAVSPILDFDAVARCPSSRSSFAATNRGAASLAAEVGNELRKWRKTREDAYVDMSRRHAQRLKRAVVGHRQIESDCVEVQKVVLAQLYDIAQAHLRDRVNEVLRIPDDACGPKFQMEDRLKKMFDTVLSPVEVARGVVPPSMSAASAVAADALARKRLRSRAQLARLPGMLTTLDTHFLDALSSSLASRKEAIKDQFVRQAEAVRCIKQALDDRIASFAKQSDVSRQDRLQIPPDQWQQLWPRGDVLDPTGLPPDTCGASDGSGDWHQKGLDVQRLLRSQASARIEMLCDEFQQWHLSDGKPLRKTSDRQDRIDMWFLEVRQDLLNDLRSSVSGSHEEVMAGLRSSFEMDGIPECLEAAASAGESLALHRKEGLDRLVGDTEVHLRGALQGELDVLRRWRRRNELCTLKRWHDVPRGFDSLRCRSQEESLMRLGEKAQRLVNECHFALPLPQEEFKTLRTPIASGHANGLVNQWAKCRSPVAERLAVVERVVESLGDTIECCAVTKAALCLVDNELRRLICRIKEPQLAAVPAT
mmetsp:Transcript_8698/g.22511  ORF Transcript_8698/g.22511 Transcript_8698/m.22511 type:complete len:570 (-) Transcript_8698:91-1800(-)